MTDTTGKVWLVGAGPSDAGLMTLRGRDVLKQADVVVYDRLLGVGVLAMIPPGAKKIDVGKSPDRHPVPQEEINGILVREALAGSRVVRLKGGDPFLFGRGAEELEELRRREIPYEVVPGVSAAIAVPAYAGIPVTHRDYSSSLHIFTGHFSQDKEADPDYSVLAGLGGTLVFLMGIASAGRICGGLRQAGMPGDTPAAVIENGTSARQRTARATLATLAGAIADQGIHSPAVIVIGRTAALSERLSWVADRPLNGKRIIVTRPRPRSEELCKKIRDLGGEAVVFPCIETAPFQPERLDEAVGRLGRFSWVAFASATGVDSFFSALCRAGKDSRTLGGIRIAAVGAATARSLASHGIRPDLVPPRFDGFHLGKSLAEEAGAGDDVLVVKARGGSRRLEEQLDTAGIPFETVCAYETRPAPPDETDLPEIRKIIESREMDRIVFTSASTVKGFAQSFPQLEFPLCTAVCIGRETADAAERFGMRAVTTEAATVDGILDALIHS